MVIKNNHSDLQNIIDSLKIVLKTTDDVELIKLMIESIIERLEELSVEDGETSNKITLK